MKRTLIILVTLCLVGCNVCGEDKLSEVSSPNKKYVATIFRRGCGATSGFLYHVNIRDAGDPFSTDYRGVIEEGQVFLTREGKISVTWNGEKTLVIDCSDCPKDRKPVMQDSWK